MAAIWSWSRRAGPSMKPSACVWVLSLALCASTAGAAPAPAQDGEPATILILPDDGPRPRAGQPKDDTAPVCRGIDVAANPARPGILRKFSARETLDLRFSIRMRDGVAVPSSFVLKLFTPNGHLYQESSFPVAAPGRAPVKRRVEGSHFPEAEARVVANRSVLAPAMPVAGTPVSQSSLYGKWLVTAAPPGKHKACSSVFVVTP